MPPRQIALIIPPSYMINTNIGGKADVVQIRTPRLKVQATVITYSINRVSGVLVQCENRRILVTDRPVRLPTDITEHLIVKRNSDLSTEETLRKAISQGTWAAPTILDISQRSPREQEEYAEAIRDGWKNRFTMKEETELNGQTTPGLRPPQIGGMYAALAHWKVTSDPATIVMPTGTGKTDTMIGLLLNSRPKRLMIVFPSDQLRIQIASKFSELSFFKAIGLVDQETPHPVIAILNGKPSSTQEVDEVFRCANVIIATMQVAGMCDQAIQDRMAHHCSHLFIDEAHHVAARTWDAFHSTFHDRMILQFTATPFRNDGKPLPGKIIFNYPLKKAQNEGFFRRINFKPIREFTKERADSEIAKKAVEQLEQDIANGFDHLIMARVSSLTRAESLLALYQSIGGQHGPRVIHSRQSGAIRRASLAALEDRSCRIIICVDMLGEGFDLPELKIAAIHDMHKSLAITLQFTGRFTRSKPNLGEAALVANIADPKVEESLSELYADDADWNSLLQDLSENATEAQILRSEFLSGFENIPDNLTLQNVFPKMSAVVYRTTCREWSPQNIYIGGNGVTLHAGPTVNPRHQVLLFVTREIESVPWGWVRDIQNTAWHLYLVHWDKDLQMLFINSSNTKGFHEKLAKQICGHDAEIIRGERIYRALHGIKRLMLMNLGLSHLINRSVRFSMHSGPDITPGLADAQGQNRTKSNLFGRGYEHGRPTTIGCSRKGKVWSYKVAWDMSEWVRWCKNIGRKLQDPNIPTDLNMHTIIRPETVTERPALVPIAIDWPDDFFRRDENEILFDFGHGETATLLDVELKLDSHEITGPIFFSIQSPQRSLRYQITISQAGISFVPLERDVSVTIGPKTTPLSQLFYEEGPVIRFSEGSFLIFNEFCRLPTQGERPLFDIEKIETWDWTGINLQKESQTFEKHADSIQRRVIEDLLAKAQGSGYQVIFDDDGKGESADVVTLGVFGNTLKTQFFHCKFTTTDTAGARIDDLYEVCGQAEKSVFWKAEVERLIGHLLRRDEKRTTDRRVSRFELGDPATAHRLLRESRFLHSELKIFIVQPGLSKSRISQQQLELLAATELYLQETYGVALGVICSP